ncbi:ribose-phosphate pyrophosphokinase [Maridesulfovibrio sp.]|uniref:ribose-phosphate diphosphokinase n=1 Tax=Maridesulfovibrio sp. TaxID=2795000 RepID=UPI0029CA98F5|nr:ribose-phosphate pyrophosphokinase [Maridesulfovibrio sp.]
MNGELKIISGSSNLALSEAICDHLGSKLTPCLREKFSDGEIRIEIQDNVRGCDVFIVQSTCDPVNFHFMELCLMLDALKRASARRVTAVVPYYGYARQDRKVSPRAPISAKLCADCLTVAGMQRLVTIDLHAGQIQGFFNLPVDNIYAAPVLLDELRTREDDMVMVSPDAGGTERARAYAKRLNAGLAIVDKRRDAPNQAKAMHVIGEVKDKVCVVMDDMIDTAGTMCQAAKVLIDHGARDVIACATHPVLSGPAIDRLAAAPFSEVIVTDTLPVPEEKLINCGGKIKIKSVAGILAKCIHNVHSESSVSVLFV